MQRRKRKRNGEVSKIRSLVDVERLKEKEESLKRGVRFCGEGVEGVRVWRVRWRQRRRRKRKARRWSKRQEGSGEREERGWTVGKEGKEVEGGRGEKGSEEEKRRRG